MGYNIHSRSALKFVILLGIVSLCADITYEGARSIIGPFLAVLGAPAAVVGIVAGVGELIGYALRLVSGYLTDRTGRYWTLTIVGYTVNLLAVPALALAGHWGIAASLIILERFGKAIRTPARDAMLSHATAKMGRGWGFGIHEAMDQLGAVLGPALVATVLYFTKGYPESFGILLVPAVLALSMLFVARSLYPHPRRFETQPTRRQASQGKGFPTAFWFYMGFIALTVAGYAPFQLMSFHFKSASLVSDIYIPIIYAVAMGVDGVVALFIGRLYDRQGQAALLAVPLLSVPIAPLVFSGNYNLALVGAMLWGAAMGVQETIMRAAIADMVPATKRGLAFGIFNSIYGLSWFIGSSIMGFLYEVSILHLVFFSVALELLSFPILYGVIRKTIR